MSKLRSVNTQFWSDPWVEDLTPSEKLLYLYFITNEKTNMLGVYELSIKKISFETGVDKSTIEKALKGFERVRKVKYTNNYIVLLNFTKHQHYNTNMKKSAIDVYNLLPKELKPNDIYIEKDNPSEGFERVVKALGMVRKIEVESEDELEDKTEQTAKAVDFDYDLFLKFINDTLGRSLRVISEDDKKKVRKRLKEGYTKFNFQYAVENCKNVKVHVESNYKHCTFEFFTRKKTLDQYGEKPKEQKNQIGATTEYYLKD